MRVVGTPQFPSSLNTSQVPVFLDPYFRITYPGSPLGELFGQKNKHHPFDSKILRKSQRILVKPRTIRSTQEDTFPHLHYSSWGNIKFQPETFHKILIRLSPPSIPASYSSGTILISHSGWHKLVLKNL